jgi:predicted alpha/beta hydrolase family esterase
MVEKNDMIKKKEMRKEKKKTLKIYRSSNDKTLSITEKILTRWILTAWKANFKANSESGHLMASHHHF